MNDNQMIDEYSNYKYGKTSFFLFNSKPKFRPI